MRNFKFSYLDTAVLLLSLTGLLSLVAGQLTTDESVFFLIGREMRHGVLPYRDLWDHKAPPIYLVAYLASFFGPLYLQIGRLLTIAFPLTGSIALLRAAGLTDKRLTLYTLSLGTAVFAALGQGMLTEQLEAGAILWAAAFLITTYTTKNPNRSAFLVGVSLGTAVLIRLPALIYLPLFALALLRQQPKPALKTGLLFLSGFALPLGLAVLLLALIGLFDDLLAVYIQGSLAYARASQLAVAQFGRLLLYQIAPNILALNALYLLLGLPGWWRLGRRTGRPIWPFLLLLAAALEALATRYGVFSHYWSILFWLLVPAAALTLWRWRAGLEKRPQSGWQLSLMLLFLLAALPAAQPLAARLQPEYRSVANELAQYVRPGDYLWVGGTTGAALYLYTDTRPAAPYFYTGAAAQLALEPEIVIEHLREKRPPILLGPDWHENGRPAPTILDPLRQYLTTTYHPQHTITDTATNDTYLLLLPNP